MNNFFSEYVNVTNLDGAVDFITEMHNLPGDSKEATKQFLLNLSDNKPEQLFKEESTHLDITRTLGRFKDKVHIALDVGSYTGVILLIPVWEYK